MLKKLIIVDYVDGSGGEYFANVLNSHSEFNCAVNPMAEDMQKVSDIKLKWFNSNGLVCNDWDENFKAHCKKFLTECQNSGVSSIAIPYHLYKYPHHVKILESLGNYTRFVSINFHKHQKLIALDYIRKVLLRPFTKENMSEISFYSRSLTTESKQQLINLLKQGQLYGIDLELARNKLELTNQNRKSLLDKYNHLMSPVTNDISIDYEDFFICLDNNKEKYYNLCINLNISPDEQILSKMIKRNQQNFKDLQKFSTEFDSITNQILTTYNQG